MNILFVTDDARHGSSIMRAVWPSLWINKFTDHHSWCIDRFQAGSPQHDALVNKADLIVLHKPNPAQKRIAEMALSRGIPFVYDTDDYDQEVFGAFYPEYWVHGSLRNDQWFAERAKGITVASEPLKKKYGGVLIENGFDTSIDLFRPHAKKYFESDKGEAFKIAWGGSSSHMRDFEMFLKLGVVESIVKDYDCDFYFYGLSKTVKDRVDEGWRGRVSFHPMHPQGIEWYIYRYYNDATILIAPLIQDEFNDNRSTLKLVEAGIAGKTIVASLVEGYASYQCREGVSLVNNTKGQWEAAIRSLLDDAEYRNHKAEKNTEYVLSEMNAKVLTEKRVRFFESIT